MKEVNAYIVSKTDLHQRYVTKDGKVVPGTTTVIDILGLKTGPLLGWNRKLMREGKDPEAMLNYYADIGTYAHALVEEHIRKQLGEENAVAVIRDEYSKEVQDQGEIGFESFLLWEDEHKVVYHASEQQLASEKYRYGGTIDILANVDGVDFVIDLKTSNQVHTGHIIQIAAYWSLYNENSGENRRAMVLKIGKNVVSYMDYEIKEDKLKKAFNVFWHLLNIFKVVEEI